MGHSYLKHFLYISTHPQPCQPLRAAPEAKIFSKEKPHPKELKLLAVSAG